MPKRTRRSRDTHPEQAVLASWLDQGLNKKNKSAKELAAILELKSPAAVTRMRQGKRLFKAHELGRISAYIEEPIPRTNGGAGISDAGAQHGVLGSAQAVPTIKVTVVIAAGVWREVGAPMIATERIAGSADPRARGVKQYACKIEGTNRYAICISYKEIRPRPTSGDTVHVRRTKGGQHEDTLRVIRVVNGHVRLQLKDGGDKSNVIEYPAAKGEDIEIKGLVIGYHEAIPF